MKKLLIAFSLFLTLPSGGQIGVAVDAATGNVKTVMNGSRIIKSRFTPVE